MHREIHDLEYACAVLMAKLDILLMTAIGSSRLNIHDGLAISTHAHSPTTRDAFVTIRPICWPEGSYVKAHFMWTGQRWELLQAGEIFAPHLPEFLPHLTFRATDTGLGILFEPQGESQKQCVEEGHDRLVQSLLPVHL